MQVDDGDDDDDDTFSDIDRTNLQVSFFLLVCSAIASIIMIGCYYCQKSRAPRLLLWLFGSNFLWFASLLVLYFLLYLKSPELEHQTTCSYLTAFYDFFMNFSMLWPSVICFDLWMNTRDPRWRWDSPQSIENWYILIVVGLASVAPISIALFPSKKYCDLTHYTPPTEFFGIGIEFVLPMCAFIFNCGVILVVRHSLKQEMPFSVRTRRRRQMHNYVLVWMFCWGPYLAHEIYYFSQSSHRRNHPTSSQDKLNHMVFLIRNATLYSTGSFDLLVYGMENAWLKRSLRMVCDSIRLTDLCCMEDVQASYLKNTNDKSVTFHNTVPQTSRAEVSKHYVTRRLSKPDKYRLYQNRPDLDPNRSLESLNRIRSEDINVNDPNFKKSMLDNRFNGGDNKRGNNNRLSKKGVISSLLDSATQSTTSSSTSSYTSASSHSPVRVSSLQEADTSFQPSAFSSPPTAIRVEPSDSLPTGLMTNRDTLTFYQDEPEPEEASAEDVIRTELMEAQEFGISPHKREESLQRAEAARAMGSSPNEATPTTSTDSNVGLLSPLIWNQHPNPDATNSGRYPDSPA